MAVQIQLRRGTSSEWTSANPILANGEFGYETDTKKGKIGDGSTQWSSLQYCLTPDVFISPLTTIGDTIYGGSSGVANRLAGNTTTTPQFLTSTGTGTAATAPAWTGSTGTGSVVLSASPTFTGTVNATDLTLSGNLTVNGTTTNINTTNLVVEDKNIVLGDVTTPSDTTADNGGITLKGASDKTFNWVQSSNAWTTSEKLESTIATSGSSNKGAFTYGTMGYSDQNTLASFTSNPNTYNQVVIQNTSSNAAASADFTISNNLGTSSTYYVNLGMNSSNFPGTGGSLNLPNAGYLTVTTGDLVLGTTTANPIRFVVNSGATDSLTISSAGVATFASAPAVSGGTSGGFLKANGSIDTATYITGSSPTITTPTIDTVNTSLTTTGTAALWNTGITTGTIAIGGALTTGTLNLAAAGTGATNINIGHTNALVGITGNTTVTGTLTSTSTIQGTTGTLTGSTLAINGASPTISSTNASAASIFTSNVTGITIGSSTATTTLYPAAATTSTASAGAGYIGMPQNSTTTGAYRLTIDDAGKHIYSTATRTITIPGNATGGTPQVAYPIGSTIVFVNASGVTLTLQMDGTTTDTCLLAGTGTSMTGGSGTRTLAAFGVATLLKITSTSWIISGNGLT